MYNQKGTGRARHGNKLAPQFRGGGKAFGPVPRSHAIELPKTVRALALKHALSAKVKSSELIILEKAELGEPKTQKLKAMFQTLGFDSALIIGGRELDSNFSLAARNIPNIDVLAVAGLNVYDILRRRKLVLTKAALEAIEERFK
jgi:large subunit ribosomal protein L4